MYGTKLSFFSLLSEPTIKPFFFSKTKNVNSTFKVFAVNLTSSITLFDFEVLKRLGKQPLPGRAQRSKV